jgi:uncharacterized membrane protein
LIATYFIPADSFLVALRYVFVIVFVSFLPGYCLVNILFMNRNRLDFVEELVLSVALSFGLDGLVGLFLGLSPIGITLTSYSVSLSIIVLAFASVALILKIKELSRLQVKAAQQISA